MTPLVVKARLLEGFVVRYPIHLDAILTAAAAMRDGLLLPPVSLAECRHIDIPIQRSACGRFWMASAGQYVPAEQELRHKHRRAPWVEYARLGSPKIRRVQIAAAENKSLRIPYEFTIPVNGEVLWWCVGDRDGVLGLLHLVHYLGKFRNSGKGRVAQWTVEPCASWGDGFPIMRDGTPLRNIPVAEGAIGAMERCEPPYSLKEGRVPCLVP